MKSSMPMHPAVAPPFARRQKMAAATATTRKDRFTCAPLSTSASIEPRSPHCARQLARLYLADCRLVAEGLLASVRFGWSH
jgi:hypothetical protein